MNEGVWCKINSGGGRGGAPGDPDFNAPYSSCWKHLDFLLLFCWFLCGCLPNSVQTNRLHLALLSRLGMAGDLIYTSHVLQSWHYLPDLRWMVGLVFAL